MMPGGINALYSLKISWLLCSLKRLGNQHCWSWRQKFPLKVNHKADVPYIK